WAPAFTPVFFLYAIAAFLPYKLILQFSPCLQTENPEGYKGLPGFRSFHWCRSGTGC
ncbi:MAG: hypothetical protein AVDCRST_MAG56-3041, partial [uncultured Cytophagales bacterium]